MYDKPITFMVGSPNIHGCIFYQMCLLPCLTFNIFSRLVLWNSDDVVVGLWIDSTSLSGYEKVCCDWLNEYLLY